MKWSFKEDYIVCKFYLSRDGYWKDGIEELMAELRNKGFTERSENAVIKRLYQYDHMRWECDYDIPNQVRRIYDVLVNRPARNDGLDAYIKENYKEDEEINDFTSDSPTNINLFVMTEPMGRKFGEVMIDFMKKQDLYDPDVYNGIYMSKSTFHDIKNNKSNPSIEKVMMLCIGLKLSYDDSVKLMAAAGHAFRNNNMTDIIVKWHLERQIYNIYEVDSALHEYNLKALFSSEE